MSIDPAIAKGYDWEKEDHGFLAALPDIPMKTAEWEALKRPDKIDTDWHKPENQGQIGSCQGNSVTSTLERLMFVRGEKVQLSRIFAYLATQRIDGLLGSDEGSTITGGCKLAVETGCCLESATGYPKQYPSHTERDKVLATANYSAAAAYKAASVWRVPTEHEKILDFIAGGGGINFGIRWYSGFIPADRLVKSYNPRSISGGHAMCVLGYDQEQNLIAFNSWGDGSYKITPTAWKQMFSYNNNVAIGLMGNKDAKPNIDWHHNSPYYK